MQSPHTRYDILIVGGGAAGLATAIFAGRAAPAARIAILDGAAKLGAKILVAGGGRCNVTNAVVTPDDYWGGSRNTIRRVLAAFPVAETREFFREIGVELHEEPNGKLFPNSNSARTVLAALLREAERCNVQILAQRRVSTVRREGDEFVVETGRESLATRRLVLATGGRSLPKTGSDGAGYELAARLGHSLVPQTPALAPLVLEGEWHTALSGIAQPVELTLRVDDVKPERLRGALLWTHFGVSGPVAMNASRVWHRARLEQRSVRVTANLLAFAAEPIGESIPATVSVPDLAAAEALLLAQAVQRPRATLLGVLSSWLPARVAQAALGELGVAGTTALAQLSREARGRVLRGLVEWPLPVRDSRGYGHAEATAGGVALDEVDPRTMESRVCPGLHLVGEILDCDGRIGGFNFQWAWATGRVAGQALGESA